MMENTQIDLKCKKFIDELNTRKPDTKLMSADRDLESMMAMRDRRTRKHGITIKEQFGPVTNPQLKAAPTQETYRDDRYFVTHEKARLSHKISFIKGGRNLYSHESQRVDTVADIVDLLNSSKLPSEAYICPNCGDISSAEELASTGCPYCGTRFSIPQLYPKVSHFSYTENFSEFKKSGAKKAIKVALIAFAISFVIFLIRSFFLFSTDNFDELASIFPTFSGVFLIFSFGLAAIIPSLIIAGIAFGITMYVNVITTRARDIYQHSSKIHADMDTQFSTRVFEKAMERYGPIFNFNYFSSRVYNLLGAMIYAESKSECPFYVGPDFIGQFDSIIDYVPIGMDIQTFDVDENGKCSIVAKVIADTYSYRSGNISHKKAEFIIRTSKNMNYPIDINFSAHTYKCDGCSASFDAVKTANCPYCGRPHDILDEEWYIDGQVKWLFK